MLDLKEIIAKAQAKDACEEAMELIEACKTVEELMAHEKAPNWAFWYALHVIKGRWPEAEEVIMRDARSAQYYAEHVIGGRWPEAEVIIMTDVQSALWYKASLERIKKGNGNA